MSTAYNQFQDSYAAKEAERGALRDPVGSGVVVVTPNDHGVLKLSAAGTVTLQPATEVPVDVEVLVLFQASVTFESVAFTDGAWAVYKVVENSSAVRVWVQVAGSNLAAANAAAIAKLGVADFSVGSYPIAFGTISLNSGDTVTNNAVKKIGDALIASGLATGTITAV